MRYPARTHTVLPLWSRGVTLVEILLVMGLLSIFLVLLTTMFTATLDSQSQTEAYSAVVSDGRFLVTRLDYDIRRASAVTTPTSLGSSDTSLVLTIGGTSYTYALSGSALQLTDGAGTADLTGSGVRVTALSFERIGNPGGKDTVRYSFTLTSVTQPVSGTQSQTFTSTSELQ